MKTKKKAKKKAKKRTQKTAAQKELEVWRGLRKRVQFKTQKISELRDGLRGDLDQLNSILASLDEGLECLDEANRYLDEGVDVLSQYL
jgi:hypothetical protein